MIHAPGASEEAIAASKDARAAVLARMQALTQQLTERPDDTELQLEMARSLGSIGETAKAESIFQRLLKQHPRHFETLLESGRLMREGGKVNGALSRLLAAAVAKPEEPSSRIEIALTFRQIVSPAVAETLDRRVAQLLGEQADLAMLRLGVGRALRDAGDNEAALALFESAARVAPKRMAIQLEIARTALQLTELDTADAAYGAALALDANEVGALLGRAEIALRRNNGPMALEWLNQAEGRTPGKPHIRLLRGRALRAAGRGEEAENVYRALIAAQPDFLSARVELAVMQRERGELRHALGELQSALAAANNADEALRVRMQVEIAQTHYQLGEFDRAAAQYRAALERQPQHKPALLGLATVCWAQGHRSEEVEQLRTAFKWHPNDAKVRLQLGFALLEEWHLTEAQEIFQGSIAKRPQDIEALCGLSQCAVQRGDIAKAKDILESVLKIEPDNPAARLDLKRLQENFAAHDWKEELRQAILVAQAPRTRLPDRLRALRQLLEYGVTDVVIPVLDGLETSNPVVRRMRQSAQQLERLGLAQPAGSLARSDDAERDELNVPSGVVERLVPGADTLVLVFCGRLNRTSLSLDIMHRILRATGASLVYLRDLERTHYLGGVVGLGADFPATLEAFRQLQARSGARRLLALGHCVGCAGAMRYGLALGAEAVLGVMPRTPETNRTQMSAAAAVRMATLRKSAPQFSADLPSLYAAAPTHPRVSLIYGADVAPDLAFARQMAEQVPDVVGAAMPGFFSEIFSALLARGILTPLLERFVATGGIPADLLAQITRPENDAAQRAAA